MIFLGIGSNLKSNTGNLPMNNCLEAINRLSSHNVHTLKASSFFETQPVPDKHSQPWYINSVLVVETNLNPFQLLESLLAIELQMGRDRTFANGPRIIDLDLLAYDNKIINKERLILPHPRMHKRGFVLKPLIQIAPDWLHPVTGMHIRTMIDNLETNQIVRPICSETCVS